MIGLLAQPENSYLNWGEIMELVQLKQDIKSKKLKKFYVFTGTELGVMGIYLSEIGNVLKADSVADIWKKLTVKNLKNESYVFCVRDDKDFLKNTELHNELDKTIKYGTLILIYQEMDKRSKFYKQFNDCIIEFQAMTKAQLVKHFLKRKNCITDLDKKEIEYLVDKCNNDYTQITLEMDKIKHYPYTIYNMYDVIDEIVESQQDWNVFTFTDALLKGKVNESIEVLQFLLGSGISSIQILAVMYKTFRNAAMVLGTNGDYKTISDSTGINSWEVTKILNNCDFSQQECMEALDIIREVDTGVKRGLYQDNNAAMIATCLLL